MERGSLVAGNQKGENPSLIINIQLRRPDPINRARMSGVFWLIFCLGTVVFGMTHVLVSENLFREFFSNGGFLFWIMLEVVCIFFSIHTYVGGRNVAKYPIGLIAKLGVDVVTLGAALATKHLLDYNVHNSYALVLLTSHFHGLWHLSHGGNGAGDLGFWDMVVDAAMQIVVCESGTSFTTSVSCLTLCAAIIFYRCWSYQAPAPAPAPATSSDLAQRLKDNFSPC